MFALISLLTLEQFPRKDQWELAWRSEFSNTVITILAKCFGVINEVGRIQLGLLHDLVRNLQLEVHHSLCFLLGYVSHQMQNNSNRNSSNALGELCRGLLLFLGFCALNNK